MIERPVIFDYLDFPAYLRDMYAHLKTQDKSFTHREFARRAGFKASSNLKLAMDGRYSLTLESIKKFAKGLGLNRAEAKYFENLVVWTQATDPHERELFENKIRRHHTAFKDSRLNQDAYDYIANWYVVALRELLEVAGAPSDARDLKKLLIPRVAGQKVEEALGILQRLGMVERVGDRWVGRQPVFETEDEIANAAGRNYHREMIGLAQAAVDRFDPAERVLGGVTSAIRAADMDELKAFVAQQRREMLTFLTKLNSRPGLDRVVQVNYQAFPVSEQVDDAD